VPFAVAGYITAAYVPCVTLIRDIRVTIAGRALSDTFAASGGGRACIPRGAYFGRDLGRHYSSGGCAEPAESRPKVLCLSRERGSCEEPFIFCLPYTTQGASQMAAAFPSTATPTGMPTISFLRPGTRPAERSAHPKWAAAIRSRHRPCAAARQAKLYRERLAWRRGADM